MCLHCNFLCPDYKDAASNETNTRKGLFFPPHIHLLIHAHCISICFPPITSITQSQSFSQHIFHFSLPSLSFINLNISTPTEWLEANTTVAAEMSVLPYVCACFFSLLLRATLPLCCFKHCGRGGDGSQQCSMVWHWCVPAPGESGRTTPSGGLFKC